MSRALLAGMATGATLTACVAAYGLHDPARVSGAADRTAAALLPVAAATQAVTLFAARRDIHPADSLGQDVGDTYEAAPNVAYRMLTDASDRLAKYSAAALKAGVDERRVRLVENQGALVAVAVRRILDALHLTPAQQTLVGEVVPRELRALATNPPEEP